MAIDPLAQLQPQTAPVSNPGFFNGEMPNPADVQDGFAQAPEGDSTQVAGLGNILNQARKKIKVKNAEVDAATAAREAELFAPEATPGNVPAPSADPNVIPGEGTRPAVEPTVEPTVEPMVQPIVEPTPTETPSEPVLRELYEERILNENGVPDRFKAANPYEHYIRVGDDDVDAVIDAPQDRDRLLEGGLEDFNEKNIVDEQGIQERIEANSKQFSGKITAAKRGVITHEATRQLSDLIGMSPKKLTRAILNREQGGMISVDGAGVAETMLAARNLMIAEMRKLDDLADLAKSGTDDQALQFRYQLELVANLQKNIKGSQTEMARGLSALRIPVAGNIADGTPAAELQARAGRDLTGILSEYGGANDIRTMAAKYSELGPAEQRTNFVAGMSKARVWANAGFEVWQHALLTNPVSLVKNVVGVMAAMFVSNVELAGAIAVNATRRAVGGEDSGLTAGDLGARMFGQTMSTWTAMKATGKAFMTAEAQTVRGSRIDSAQGSGRKHMKAFSGEAFGATGVAGTTIDVAGNILTAGRVAFRGLEAGDTFFKVLSQQGSMWEQAFGTGNARGLKGEELSDFIADFLTDPPAKAVDRADAEARYVTLQTDLDSTGKAFQQIQRAPVMRWIVPFLKTPYNGFKYSFVDRSPLGLWYGNTARMLKSGGKERDEAIARLAISHTIGVSIMGLVAAGKVTGGGPANFGDKATDRRLGIQPYSVLIDGKYYSYAATEPLASIIGQWADAAHTVISSGMEETKGMDVLGAALAGTAYNMTNKGFMQGFSKMLEAATDPIRHAKGLGKNFVKSLVPRALAHAERLDDPIVRHARDYIDEIKAQIPGLSKDLLPRVDLHGRDTASGVPDGEGGYNLAFGPDLVSPIFVSEYKANPVDLELKRLQVHLRTPAETITAPGLEAPIQLTDAQRYWYQKKTGELWTKRVSEYMKTSQYKKWKKMSEAKNAMVSDIMRLQIKGIHLNSRQEALGKLMQDSPYAQELNARIGKISEIEQQIKRIQGSQL